MLASQSLAQLLSRRCQRESASQLSAAAGFQHAASAQKARSSLRPHSRRLTLNTFTMASRCHEGTTIDTRTPHFLLRTHAPPQILEQLRSRFIARFRRPGPPSLASRAASCSAEKAPRSHYYTPPPLKMKKCHGERVVSTEAFLGAKATDGDMARRADARHIISHILKLPPP